MFLRGIHGTVQHVRLAPLLCSPVPCRRFGTANLLDAPGLALYRALLAAAPKIALPAEIQHGFGPKANPIATFVRRAFRRNRADTSPRLVYPALQAGYRILTMLTRAAAASPASPPVPSPTSSSAARKATQTPPGSAEYKSLLGFLQARLAERNATFAAKALHPPHSRTPAKTKPARHEQAPPSLLVKVTPAPTQAQPRPKPVYTIPSRPRPLEALGGRGRRKVPHMDMASDLPFLRVKKPQPAQLSRILTQRMKVRADRLAQLTYLTEEAIEDAREEDEWEDLVRRQQWAEGARAVPGEAGGGGRGGSYRGALAEHAIDHMYRQITEEREDAVARADAMRDLIRRERELYVREKAERERAAKERWVLRVKEQRAARIKRCEERLAREAAAGHTPSETPSPPPETPSPPPETKPAPQSRKRAVKKTAATRHTSSGTPSPPLETTPAPQSSKTVVKKTAVKRTAAKKTAAKAVSKK